MNSWEYVPSFKLKCLHRCAAVVFCCGALLLSKNNKFLVIFAFFQNRMQLNLSSIFGWGYGFNQQITICHKMKKRYWQCNSAITAVTVTPCPRVHTSFNKLMIMWPIGRLHFYKSEKHAGSPRSKVRKAFDCQNVKYEKTFKIHKDRKSHWQEN